MKKAESNQSEHAGVAAEDTVAVRHLDAYEVELLLQFFNILHRWDREMKANQAEQ